MINSLFLSRDSKTKFVLDNDTDNHTSHYHTKHQCPMSSYQQLGTNPDNKQIKDSELARENLV